MTVVLFSALVIQVVDFLRECADWRAQRSAIVTQVTAWVGGVILVILGAHAAVTAALVLPGADLALGHLDFGSQVLVGLLVSSLASTIVDAKQAVDNNDSAGKPPLLRRRPSASQVSPDTWRRKMGLGEVTTGSANFAATYTQTLAAVNAKLDRILAAVTGTTTPPVSPPAPPTPPPTPTPTPIPAPVPPTPPADVQAVYWINKSQGDITDAECVSFVQAMNMQAAQLINIWPGMEPVAHIFWTGAVGQVPAAGWPMYFLPDADVAGALGFHSVDPQGRPYGRVFTRYQGKPWPALRPGPEGISISNIASHEGGEIQGDPSCAATATAPNGDVWALEDADPVEAFCYDITVPDGTVVSMSDLVGAAFFGIGNRLAWADLMGKAEPFTISPGGYAIVNSKQIFADQPSLRYLSQQGSPAGRTARRLAAH